MKDGFSFTLNSPLTKEDWNKICDVELEHTKKIVYKTPSGKEVAFIPLSELEEIRDEIRFPKEELGLDFCDGLAYAVKVISNHIKERTNE